MLVFGQGLQWNKLHLSKSGLVWKLRQHHWNYIIFHPKFWVKNLTWKLSHFYLDEVYFIAILVQKQAFKKKVCPKIQKMKSKNFPEKIQVQKNRFSNRYNSKTKDRRHIKVGWFVILTRFPIEWYYHNSKNKKFFFHLYMNFFQLWHRFSKMPEELGP